MGPRTDGRSGGRENFGGRENSHRNNFGRGQQDTQEIDAWDASQVTAPDMQHNKSEDTWGDWDNEEYTGSLNDTKVFTPSTQGQGSLSSEYSFIFEEIPINRRMTSPSLFGISPFASQMIWHALRSAA